MKRNIIAPFLLLLLNACSVPEPQEIVPPPEVTQHAAPLPPAIINTADDCVNDDLRVVRLYRVLSLQNDEKADWIATIYGVK